MTQELPLPYNIELEEVEHAALVRMLDFRLRQCSAYGYPDSNSPSLLREEADILHNIYKKLTARDHTDYIAWSGNLL